MRRLARHAWLIGALWLVVAPAATAAQEAEGLSASTRAMARRHFEAGVAAARDGRWEEARDAFGQSYRLHPEPVALMNLAGAQARTGQLVAAMESYRTFLRDATEGRATELRPAVERALAELEPRVPLLTVTGRDLPGGTLVLDGVALPPAAAGEAIPVDPGQHRIALRVGERDGEAVDLDLEEGDRRSVALSGPPPEAPSPAEVAAAAVAVDPGPAAADGPLDPTPAGPRRRSAARSPWLWTAVGLVVVGAVASAVAVRATRSRGPGCNLEGVQCPVEVR